MLRRERLHAIQREEHLEIHGDEDEENDLDSPEMRPDDFREQLLIAGDKAARLAPEIEQAFQIVNDSRNQQIDNGLPSYVVDQRFVRKTIDQRQHVRNQDRLAENEGGNGN